MVDSLIDLLAPIPGADPGGKFLRYDQAYVAIAEARKEGDAAMRRDIDAPRQTADHVQVIRVATEFLAKKSKDLQIAVWLTEAWLRMRGFGGLRQGLELTEALLNQFWDYVHPRLDDGDLAYRAAPLVWLGSSKAMNFAVITAPLNEEGHGLSDYKECMKIPTEAETRKKDTRGERQQAKAGQERRANAKKEGKLMPEAFRAAVAATPKAWYKALVGDIDGALRTLQSLQALGADKFGEDAPSYVTLAGALAEVHTVARQLLDTKLGEDPDPIEPEPPVEAGVPASVGGTVGAGGALGYADDDIRFTAFYPKRLKAGIWSSLLAYAHIPAAFDTVQKDSTVRLWQAP